MPRRYDIGKPTEDVMAQFTRRTFLGSAAMMPLAASPLLANAPMMGTEIHSFYRFKLGAYEITTLLAATITRPDPHSIFGLNVSAEEFATVSAAANLPTDQSQFFFTPTVVNTGSQLVLFDTGLSPDGIKTALMSAGYTPDQIDLVVITHMHGDHIGGLTDGAGPTFPNANYATGRVEFDAWAGMGNEKFDSNMRPFAEQTTMMEDGASAFAGHTAMAAFGHTPGHMAHMIESEGKSLIIAADFANHYVWSLARPDWEVKFDMDKPAAAATRKRLLDMMAADKLPFVGYHMPWPGIGFVSSRNSGYEYQPISYQMML